VKVVYTGFPVTVVVPNLIVIKVVPVALMTELITLSRGKRGPITCIPTKGKTPVISAVGMVKYNVVPVTEFQVAVSMVVLVMTPLMVAPMRLALQIVGIL
jgi:hypothetical protein